MYDKFFAAAILLALCLVAPKIFAESVEYWTTNSLEKVFPDTARPQNADTKIALKAARNETEDAQIVLRMPKDVEVPRAEFILSDLAGPNGAVIAKGNVSARWIWYTYVLNNPKGNKDPSSYLRKAPAFFPDGFLETKTLKLRDEWTQPLWVSVRVPKGTPAGEYSGKIELNADDSKGSKNHFAIPVTVSVWPFTLPDEFHLHHTEWFSYGGLAEYYHVPLWSDAHWDWIAKVAADMAAHKQDTILTPFSALVDIKKISENQFQFDFTRLDRWVETFKKAGVTWIEGGHVAGRCKGWESDIVWSRLPIADGNGKPIDVSAAALSEDQFEPYMKAFLQAVHAHLKEKGWADRYIQHIADEPIAVNEKSWIYRAKRVREWLPGVPIVDAVMSKGLEGAIDIRVPQIQHCKLEGKRPKKETTWSYVCLYPQGQFPNRFLDYPSIRNRILFWLSYTQDLKGFLHWGYSHWQVWDQVPARVDVSPWFDATGGSILVADRQPLPAGDPFIVYPGKSQICDSIRWEVVRKGMEDYEYLYILDHALKHHQHAKRAVLKEARELLKQVKTDIAAAPDSYTRDDALLLKTREKAGELLAVLAAEKS